MSKRDYNKPLQTRLKNSDDYRIYDTPKSSSVSLKMYQDVILENIELQEKLKQIQEICGK